jgi:hypothetical protein
VRATLNTTRLQRCQFHRRQNARAHIPNPATRRRIDADIGSVFDAPDRARAEANPAGIPLAVARGTRGNRWALSLFLSGPLNIRITECVYRHEWSRIFPHRAGNVHTGARTTAGERPVWRGQTLVP